MMATPTTMWLKLARRLGSDGNPLRRRSDLISGWLAPVAIAVFLVLCPLVAGLTGAAVRADITAARHAARSWQRAPAVLLQSAAGPEMTDNGANTWTVPTPARWTADGRQHVGYIPAPAKSRAGRTVPVLLNASGQVQPPPPTAAQASARVDTATTVALCLLALVLAGLSWLARRILDRRKLAGWESEWLVVGPRWSRQP
jgi:hypothetical protein